MIKPGRFIRVDNAKLNFSGRIRNRVVLDREAFIGDFVSRIWANFGAPDQVDFEGFSYAFQDTETGLFFSAYSAGSGPAYGGFREREDELLAVLDVFDQLLEASTPADCDIEYETDFGLYHSGAKDGEPYDEMIESFE